jgi:hypothetical protein
MCSRVSGDSGPQNVGRLAATDPMGKSNRRRRPRARRRAAGDQADLRTFGERLGLADCVCDVFPAGAFRSWGDEVTFAGAAGVAFVSTLSVKGLSLLYSRR